MSLKATFNTLFRYIRAYRDFWRENGLAPSFFHTIKFFPTWMMEQTSNSSALEVAMPWMSMPAVDYLSRKIKNQNRIFEWGMGGSTRFFLNRCHTLISVEHDPTWYEKCLAKVGPSAKWKPLLIHPESVPPDFNQVLTEDAFARPENYLSSDGSFSNATFKAYANSIGVQSCSSFDVVLVDGRARPSCLNIAKDFVAIGGMLVLDNSNRTHYLKCNLLSKKKWKRLDFIGPTHCDAFFSMTTIWKKISV